MASIAPGVSLEDRRFEVRRFDRIAGLLESESADELAEHGLVRSRLADRRDDRTHAVEAHRAVADGEIVVLEERGCGQ